MTNEEINALAEQANEHFKAAAEAIDLLRVELGAIAGHFRLERGIGLKDVKYGDRNGQAYTASRVYASVRMDEAFSKLRQARELVAGIGGAQTIAIQALTTAAEEVRNA